MTMTPMATIRTRARSRSMIARSTRKYSRNLATRIVSNSAGGSISVRRADMAIAATSRTRGTSTLRPRGPDAGPCPVTAARASATSMMTTISPSPSVQNSPKEP